jgi:hypothetical protein
MTTHATAQPGARALNGWAAERSLEIRRRVGFLPGDCALYPKLSGAKVLDYLGALRGRVDRRVRDSLSERFDADLDNSQSQAPRSAHAWRRARAGSALEQAAVDRVTHEFGTRVKPQLLLNVSAVVSTVSTDRKSWSPISPLMWPRAIRARTSSSRASSVEDASDPVSGASTAARYPRRMLQPPCP